MKSSPFFIHSSPLLGSERASYEKLGTDTKDMKKSKHEYIGDKCDKETLLEIECAVLCEHFPFLRAIGRTSLDILESGLGLSLEKLMAKECHYMVVQI